MKTLFFFLLSACCAVIAFGAEYYNGAFTFRTGGTFIPVCYKYAIAGAATSGDVNEPLVENEIFRVCIVRDKRGAAVNEQTVPAVTIDAAGQLVLGENAISAKWMTLRWVPFGEATPISAAYACVGDVAGAPSCKLWVNEAITAYGFDVFTTEDLPQADDGTISASAVYMYLVAMDTRKGTGECEGLPMHVKAYAMALCRGKKDSTAAEASPFTPRAWEVGATTNTGITVCWPGTHLSWQPAAAITSLKITQEGEEVVLTGEALAAYLKPSVSGFARTVDETGQPCCTLTAAAPDVHYYTLYTKASLNDAEWTSFADFIAANEKILDKTLGKQYTRFRIDGESPLTIPVIEGENTRFYLLRGE